MDNSINLDQHFTDFLDRICQRYEEAQRITHLYITDMGYTPEDQILKVISALVQESQKSAHIPILIEIYQNITITKYHIEVVIKNAILGWPSMLVYLSKRFGQFIEVTTKNGVETVDLVMELATSHVDDNYKYNLKEMHKLLNVLGSKLQIRLNADNKYAFDYFKADENTRLSRKDWKLYKQCRQLLRPPWSLKTQSYYHKHTPKVITILTLDSWKVIPLELLFNILELAL